MTVKNEVKSLFLKVSIWTFIDLGGGDVGGLGDDPKELKSVFLNAPTWVFMAFGFDIAGCGREEDGGFPAWEYGIIMSKDMKYKK